jgi:TRAP-type C4-dicarboxylate transport system permease small subunit
MSTLITILQRVFAIIAGVALVLMLGVAVLDMVTRAAGAPLPGSYEIIGWLAAVSMGSALAHTQANKGHVSIDLVLASLPGKARLVIEAVVYLLSLLLIGLAAYQLFIYAAGLQASGSLSQTLRAPVYPWVYAFAAAVGVFALVLARDLVGAVAALVTGKGGALQVGNPKP